MLGFLSSLAITIYMALEERSGAGGAHDKALLVWRLRSCNKYAPAPAPALGTALYRRECERTLRRRRTCEGRAHSLTRLAGQLPWS